MIYFIRHGESQANADNIFGGPDSPLTAKGRLQAKLAGEKLKADNIIIDRITASTYRRSVDTARIIAEVIGFDQKLIKYDYRLVEYDCGKAIGRSIDSMPQAYMIKGPGAEDPEKFRARVIKAFAEIESLPSNILVVSHAGVGCMMQAIKLGLPSDKFIEIQDYPNGEVIQLEVKI
jgi:broad specificity phosphatase PhoE